MAATIVPWKFYKTSTNGQVSYAKMSGFNTPYGYTEVSPEEFNAWTGPKLVDPNGKFVTGVVTNEKANQPSDYVNIDGTMWNKKDYEKSQSSIASGYTGETAKLQNGSTVYKLKNGTVTATPPKDMSMVKDQSNTQSNTQGAYMSGVGQPEVKYQILDLSSMAKYKPNQYTRQSNGSVILNPGVQPISGTVKTIGGLPEIKPTEFTQFPKANIDTGFEEIPSEGGNIAEPDLSIYDTFINNDPFLSEQFQDQTLRDNFAKMSPTLQMAYIQMMQSLGKQIEAGKVINPNIEITPEQVKEFTDQATKELDPYYQEQIRNYQKDLDTSITRLTEDFNTGVRNAEDPFKRNLAVQAENEAQAGTVYGSERGVRENLAVSDQQQKIDELSKTVGRSIQDTKTQAERTLGSDVFGTSSYNMPTYGVSNQGISTTGSRTVFSPTGGLIGELPKEKTTAIKSRASELEEAFRNQRILNLNI